MNSKETLFLDVLRCSIRNKKFESEEYISKKQWEDVIQLALMHDVLPLIVDSIYTDESIICIPALLNSIYRKSKRKVLQQAAKTSDFLYLIDQMKDNGLYPIVLKGIICRSLYVKPELRPSTDEDLLINPEKICTYHLFMCNNGFKLVDPNTNIEVVDEVSYYNENNSLYIEIHKYPFPRNEESYSVLNKGFEDIYPPLTEIIYNTEIRTLNYTDHLLYMICHAYKHVLYGGIGIRQICDIGLFAEKYEASIKWNQVFQYCTQFNIALFLSAILLICQDYLGIDIMKMNFDRSLVDNIDPEPLLEDILSGGSFGTSDENRAHSATMTLKAVASCSKGEHSAGILKSLFPSSQYMKQKYQYLNKKNWLLPVAWAQRILEYSLHSNGNVNASKSLNIGKKRIELLKLYKIIH